MYVQDMSKLQGEARADGVVMTNFFGYELMAGDNVKMGHGIFPPGTVVPPAAHDEDEYSFILSGTVNCEAGGKLNVLKGGCGCFIPAGEVHSTRNDSNGECHVVWMLVKK